MHMYLVALFFLVRCFQGVGHALQLLKGLEFLVRSDLIVLVG